MTGGRAQGTADGPKGVRVAMAALVAALLAFSVSAASPSVSDALALTAGPPPQVDFGTPSAISRLGDPLSFTTTLETAEPLLRVELVSSVPGAIGVTVTEAEVTRTGDGSYEASVAEDGPVSPNTTIEYRFRVVTQDHRLAEGPQATTTMVDDRFDWRTIQGPIVRLHWYDGDEAFARRALDIGEAAIADASELLGVTETDPVDFFIYASEDAFRGALGPGTRENVGGQANVAIRTLFGLIEPTDIGSAWVDVLVTHELSHLVFATAVENPYHDPPRWLNEGLSVYMSEGLTVGDASSVRSAANAGELIPLEALGGFFPTTHERFDLAYAESVSAVDFFIDTHGEDDLVALIRSYGGGVTDDEAFVAATGTGLGAFDAAWIASLDAQMPEPHGPRPAPPGPLPEGWAGSSPEPGLSSAARGAMAPAAAPAPGGVAAVVLGPLATIAGPDPAVVLAGAGLFLVVVAASVIFARRRAT